MVHSEVDFESCSARCEKVRADGSTLSLVQDFGGLLCLIQEILFFCALSKT
jgi:hypothetical protein